MDAVLERLQADPALAAAVAVAVLAVVGGAAALLRKQPAAIEEDDDATYTVDSPDEVPDTPAVVDAPKEPSLLERLRTGLAKTSSALGLGAVFGRSTVDEQLFEDLEDALLGADVGVKTSMALLDELRAAAKRDKIEDPAALRAVLGEAVLSRLQDDNALATGPSGGPLVILVVGVNGSGKTTTIGKLAARYRREGKKVLLGAGDTFRAGAIEQLKVWADRAEADIVAHQEGADPAAVLFDTLKAAEARGADVVICDTAGRLQSKRPLMDELGKVHRVVGKAMPGAPHETLLVLDATIGQNALSQARTFGEVTDVSGVVLTKLDGTAKGGVVVAVAAELGLPVKLIGIGEGVDDLRPFEAEAFTHALLGLGG